MATKA